MLKGVGLRSMTVPTVIPSGGGKSDRSGRRAAWRCGKVRPRRRSAGRRNRHPSEPFPGRQRRPHRRGKSLKLGERLREWQVGAVENIHNSISILRTQSIPSGCMRKADRNGINYTNYRGAYLSTGKAAIISLWRRVREPAPRNGLSPFSSAMRVYTPDACAPH